MYCSPGAWSIQRSNGLHPGALNFTVLDKAEFLFLPNFLMLVVPGICLETCWFRAVEGWCFSSEFSPHLNLLPCRITSTPWGHSDKAMACDLLQRVQLHLKSCALHMQVIGAMNMLLLSSRQCNNHKGPGIFLWGVSKININRVQLTFL